MKNSEQSWASINPTEEQFWNWKKTKKTFQQWNPMPYKVTHEEKMSKNMESKTRDEMYFHDTVLLNKWLLSESGEWLQHDTFILNIKPFHGQSFTGH